MTTEKLKAAAAEALRSLARPASAGELSAVLYLAGRELLETTLAPMAVEEVWAVRDRLPVATTTLALIESGAVTGCRRTGDGRFAADGGGEDSAALSEAEVAAIDAAAAKVAAVGPASLCGDFPELAEDTEHLALNRILEGLGMSPENAEILAEEIEAFHALQSELERD